MNTLSLNSLSHMLSKSRLVATLLRLTNPLLTIRKVISTNPNGIASSSPATVFSVQGKSLGF